MKTYIIILIFFSSIIQLYSQCGQATICPDKEYSYNVCKNDQGVKTFTQICSNDPMSEPDPPYKIQRAQFPVKLRFCDTGPTEVQMQIQTGAWIPVYKKSFLQNDADNSTYNWNCVCGLQNSQPACTLNYEFSSNPLDFAPYPANTTARAFITVNANTCESRCDKQCGDQSANTIRLNNSSNFTGTAPNNSHKNKFFINDEFFDLNPDYFDNFLDGFIAYNLSDLLTHELGHLIGLHHHKVQNPDGTVTNLCDDADGVMGTQIAKNDKSLGLSIDDICAFKKIYCPSLVPVEDKNEDNTIKSEIFPNPFEDKTIISFKIQTDNSMVSLSIYDCLGNKIKTLINTNYIRGEYQYILDASKFSSGFYYFNLIVDDIIQTKKFILIK